MFVKGALLRIDLPSVSQGEPTGGNQPIYPHSLPPAPPTPRFRTTCSPLIAPLDPQLFLVGRFSLLLLMGHLCCTFMTPGGLSAARAYIFKWGRWLYWTLDFKWYFIQFGCGSILFPCETQKVRGEVKQGLCLSLGAQLRDVVLLLSLSCLQPGHRSQYERRPL